MYVFLSKPLLCFSHNVVGTVVLSDRLVEKAKMCEIRSEIYGASDHCPLVLEIESPL